MQVGRPQHLGLTMVKFIQVRDRHSKLFREAMNIYVSSFPDNERHRLDVIRERIASGRSKLWVGILGDSVVLIAMLWPLAGTDFILLDYMAVREDCRGQGLGTTFLKKMRKVVDRNSKYLVMEIENPDCEPNTENKSRRLSFYRRNGAGELKGVRYILPPLQGDTPTEMILMLFPVRNCRSLEAHVVRDLIIRIYRELYDRGEDDRFLKTILSSVKGRVKLA